MKQYPVPANYLEQLEKEFLSFDERFHKIFDLELMIVRQSFIDESQALLNEMGWELQFVPTPGRTTFHDDEHMSYVTKKIIPIAVSDNGCLIHDFTSHLFPLLKQARKKRYNFFNKLSEIMSQEGSFEEKMVDAAFFEVCSSVLSDDDSWFNVEGMLDSIMTDAIKNILSMENASKYHERFNQSSKLINESLSD